MSLQASAVVGLDADTGIHREAAVLVGQHLFGLETLQQATAHKSAAVPTTSSNTPSTTHT